MKRSRWRKHHKWIGICISFFLIMFCLSGIILNHRKVFADLNVTRSILPPQYHFKQWNNGLLKGTIRCQCKDKVLLYGSAGIFFTNSSLRYIKDYNKGLPSGADYRQIKGVVETSNGTLFAASIMGLYKKEPDGWVLQPLPLVENDDLLTDITTKGDTLVVLSRSNLFYAAAPYTTFHRLNIQPSPDDDGKFTLFRQMWLLHSGGLFGLVGKLVVDGIAVILILLCLTGLWFWQNHRSAKALRWHIKLGAATLVLTLFTTITGWALRPPVMIALVTHRSPPLPGSSLDQSNAWNDKLRMIRFDDEKGDWLLSTSDGFFSLQTLSSKPIQLQQTPPISVMGQTVWQRHKDGGWIVGSFAGLYHWYRAANKIEPYDKSLVEPVKIPGTAPKGQTIAGYSDDFKDKVCIVDYYDGTPFTKQPSSLTNLPMSLWNLALEVHTGRIYMGALGSFIFIFLCGLLIIWVLWSGKKLSK